MTKKKRLAPEDVDGGQLFASLSETVLARQEVVRQVTNDEDKVAERRRTVRKCDILIGR